MFKPLPPRAYLIIALALVALFGLPLVAGDSYSLHVMILAMIFGIFAAAYNLVTGYTGLKTFGHHAFFGLAAYGSALLSINLAISPWISIWLAGLVAMLFGLFVGLPVLRLKSMPHVAIVTLAFAEIVRISIANLSSVTRGEMGLWGIPNFEGFTLPLIGPVVFNPAEKLGYYYLAAVLLLAALLAIALVLRSRVGLALLAIRDGEDAAESLGINLTRYKLFVFAFSAFIVGISGAFYAHYIGILTPSAAVGADVMILVIAMVLVGGLGTFTGPLVGALLLTLLGETLRILEDYRLLVYGAMIVVTVLFLPRGLATMGELFRRRPLSQQER